MANIYVRAGASGAANGTDWTNAYTAIPSAITRGDTVYVADGSYGTPNALDDAVSSTTVSRIKKATIADHGTSTGWDNTYGDGQAAFSGNLFIHTGYWVVDGVTGGGPGSWRSGHGFQFKTIQIIRSDFEINDPVPGGNIELRHFKTLGTLTPGTDDAISTASLDGLIVSHWHSDQTDNCPLNLYQSTNIVVEFSCQGEFTSDVANHAEIAFIYGKGGIILRWNLFRHAESTGGIMVNNPDEVAVEVYGNAFYRASGETWSYGGDGLVGGWSNLMETECHNVKVYHNTFIGIDEVNSGGNCAAVIGTTPHSGLEWKGNYFYASDSGLPNGAWSADYNHYQDSGSESESNGTTGTGSPFMSLDEDSEDFARLSEDTAATDAGLAEIYRTDWWGNVGTTRGAIQSSEGEEPVAADWNITTANIMNLIIG